MEMFNSRRLTRIGVTTALYVAATILCGPLSYEAVQFRVSEMLMLLCYYDKDYIISMTLGCFIANLYSVLGMVDMVFGTSATLIAALLIWGTRKQLSLPAASLFPVVSNALLIGLEIKITTGAPFWLNAGFVALGEFVCVSVGGVIVFKLLERNKGFMRLIVSDNGKQH